VADLFSLPAVSDAKKDMSKREMTGSGKGLPMFWNLLESSSTVCPQTFESRPCFRSQNPKLACRSKFIKFLPSSEFTARPHNSRNTLIFSWFRKKKKKSNKEMFSEVSLAAGVIFSHQINYLSTKNHLFFESLVFYRLCHSTTCLYSLVTAAACFIWHGTQKPRVF